MKIILVLFVYISEINELSAAEFKNISQNNLNSSKLRTQVSLNKLKAEGIRINKNYTSITDDIRRRIKEFESFNEERYRIFQSAQSQNITIQTILSTNISSKFISANSVNKLDAVAPAILPIVIEEDTAESNEEANLKPEAYTLEGQIDRHGASFWIDEKLVS